MVVTLNLYYTLSTSVIPETSEGLPIPTTARTRSRGGRRMGSANWWIWEMICPWEMKWNVMNAESFLKKTEVRLKSSVSEWFSEQTFWHGSMLHRIYSWQLPITATSTWRNGLPECDLHQHFKESASPFTQINNWLGFLRHKSLQLTFWSPFLGTL